MERSGRISRRGDRLMPFLQRIVSRKARKWWLLSPVGATVIAVAGFGLYPIVYFYVAIPAMLIRSHLSIYMSFRSGGADRETAFYRVSVTVPTLSPRVNEEWESFTSYLKNWHDKLELDLSLEGLGVIVLSGESESKARAAKAAFSAVIDALSQTKLSHHYPARIEIEEVVQRKATDASVAVSSA